MICFCHHSWLNMKIKSLPFSTSLWFCVQIMCFEMYFLKKNPKNPKLFFFWKNFFKGQRKTLTTPKVKTGTLALELQ